MANEQDYDPPADISTDLDIAEDRIEDEVVEEAFFDYEDRGMCPVCSLKSGKDVPIPKDQTCPNCGGFENLSVAHPPEKP
jgi:rubredoxin